MKRNTRNHIRIGPKWIDPDLYSYLKQKAEERNVTDTTIINEALKLHKNKYGSQETKK